MAAPARWRGAAAVLAAAACFVGCSLAALDDLAGGAADAGSEAPGVAGAGAAGAGAGAAGGGGAPSDGSGATGGEPPDGAGGTGGLGGASGAAGTDGAVGTEAGGGPTCSDGALNGDEEGVDCGGSACPRCGVTLVGGLRPLASSRAPRTALTITGSALGRPERACRGNLCLSGGWSR